MQELLLEKSGVDDEESTLVTNDDDFDGMLVARITAFCGASNDPVLFNPVLIDTKRTIKLLKKKDLKNCSSHPKRSLPTATKKLPQACTLGGVPHNARAMCPVVTSGKRGKKTNRHICGCIDDISLSTHMFGQEHYTSKYKFC